MRRGQCPNQSYQGEIGFKMSNESCRELGGMIVDRDGSALCNFDICNENTPNEMILSKLNDTDTIKKSFNNLVSSLTPIKMEPCMTDDILQTNYKYRPTNSC